MIHIILLEPEIPQNTGNISRTCAVTVCHLHLIVPLGFELSDRTIKRAGLDYWQYLTVSRYKNWDEFKTKNKGKFYYLTRYGKKPHTSFDYSNTEEEIYLVFGKESTGIPKEILKDDLDHCMRIPINANIRSLNLSNCVAIMLFEVLRQQDYRDLLSTEPFKGENYLEE